MLRFIPMKLFSLSPYFLILLTPAGSSPAGRERGGRRWEHPRGAPGLESGLGKQTQQEGISVYLCHPPPPAPSEVLQVQAALNPNSCTEPGQLPLSHARHGQPLHPGTARGSPRTERPARALYPGKTGGEVGPGLGPGASPSSPCGTGRGSGSPGGAGAGSGSGAPPHPHITLPRVGRGRGRGRDPARVRRCPRPQSRSGPCCSCS